MNLKQWVNMFESEYRNTNSICASDIKNAAVSMQEYAHWKTHKKTPTESMIFGTNMHSIVLEGARFVGAEKFDLRKTADKERKAAFEEINKDKIVLSADRFEDAISILKSLSECKLEGVLVTELLKPMKKELSGFVDDRKIRCDAIDDLYLPDLKTTCAKSFEEMNREFFNRGYHIQAAFYHDTALMIDDKKRTPICVFMQTVAPYSCVALKVSEEILQLGRSIYLPHLEAIREYEKTKILPVFGEGKRLTPPRWIEGITDEDIEFQY